MPLKFPDAPHSKPTPKADIIEHSFLRLLKEIDTSGREPVCLDEKNLHRDMRAHKMPVAKNVAKELIWLNADNGRGTLTVKDIMRMYTRCYNDTRGRENKQLCVYLLFRAIQEEEKILHDRKLQAPANGSSQAAAKFMVSPDQALQVDQILQYICRVMDIHKAIPNVERIFGKDLYDSPHAQLSACEWVRVLSTALWTFPFPLKPCRGWGSTMRADLLQGKELNRTKKIEAGSDWKIPTSFKASLNDRAAAAERRLQLISQREEIQRKRAAEFAQQRDDFLKVLAASRREVRLLPFIASPCGFRSLSKISSFCCFAHSSGRLASNLLHASLGVFPSVGASPVPLSGGVFIFTVSDPLPSPSLY
uniref:Uncharacterized protein n=1 Tax=Chromera velia CCMP2878 TaxID=1169474 RepID=A0A0G4G3L1_9ALVE|eukprot:Cvel_19982.t1-p1 / transcript=Cvel_19982.t1 / gene=Cvel_19982 / organism=Chromera_velia_CCMP2878 / gene_product=hypothetical protein / transcript_product=hypothetical protein / location=Cvel_scaffold1760:24492-27973(+) / protein_length=362 / sequence_SO=supercontig / SO=protein_coding / is_pseudo=false